MQGTQFCPEIKSRRLTTTGEDQHSVKPDFGSWKWTNEIREKKKDQIDVCINRLIITREKNGFSITDSTSLQKYILQNTVFRETIREELFLLFLPRWGDVIIVITFLQAGVLSGGLKDRFRLRLLVSWSDPEWFFLALLLIAEENRPRIFFLCWRLLQSNVLHDVRR